MSQSFFIFFPVGSWANKNEKHFKQLRKKEELHRVRRKCFSAVLLEGLVLFLCKLQILFFSCASFPINLGNSEMTIVSKTCSDNGFFSNLLMNMNPFNQIRTSSNRETFICIKYVALFRLATWIPSGGGGKVSTVMLISDEQVCWCQRQAVAFHWHLGQRRLILLNRAIDDYIWEKFNHRVIRL